MKFRKIVIGYDGLEHSKKALNIGLFMHKSWVQQPGNRKVVQVAFY
mgnify:CR=1 FL=1